MKRTDQTRNLTLWRLRWQIRLTWAGLLAERIVRAFWPVWSILLAVYAGLALGLTERLPQVWFNGLGIAAAVLALGLAVRGLRGLRLPSRAQAMARLDATLPGRPLAALTDTQAIGSGEVWQAHVARMSDRAAKARAPVPDVRLNARDPYALRYTALLLALVALGFGSTGRLAGIAGVGPQGAQALAVGPVWEGWVRPPGYTGKPALYLNDITAEGLELPQGSRVILRFYGEAGALGVDESVSGAPLEQTAAQGAEFTVERHGRIEITGPNGRGWDIGVLRDLPPTIAATATPEREADGRMKLPFTASDDYGVVAGRAQIALDLPEVDRRHGLAAAPEPREPVVLDLPLPFTGSRTEIMETLLDDLSKHPFANLPVQIRLSAEDAPGQSGEAEPLATILPGKRFFDPLAAAVAEARRDILWTAENAVRAAQILRAVTHLPENFIRNERAFLRLRVAIRQLEGAMTPELRDQLSDELWEIALLMEQGDLASALERLKRAQDRLDEAMKNGASESEIAELMQELRDALDNYMRQLAQEADRAPDQQMSDMQGMQMTGDQLQQLLDKLQELMEQGRMAEAQELMEMLRQLMENMQVTQGQGGQGDGQGRMRDLADTLREQQGLSDEAFRDMQEGMDRNMGRQPGSQGEQGQGEQGEGEGEQGRGGPGQGREGAEGGEGQGGERGLADRQRDLRNRLRALGQAEMPGEGSERGQAGRQALDRAGRAMEGAEQALRDGDTPRALDRQAEAMEALREGMREFGEAMAEERREQGGDGLGEQFGEGDPRGQRDPLGRDPSGRNLRGPTEGGPLADGEDPYRRALDLLQELRRRSGDLGRSEDERDYLRRLLDQF